MFFLFLCLLLPSSSSLLALNFKSVFSLQRISVENLPPRGFGATCCACVSFALEIFRDLPMVNTVSQTMNEQVSSSWIRRSLMANRFQSNVICCLETKNAPWRQSTVWRYGAHHRIDERCEFSSLGTMRGPRTARDAIINSLRSALREELTSLLPVGTSRGTIEYIREGYHERITMAHCPSFESRRF